MNPSPAASRRDFFATSARALGGGWLALHLPLLSSLAACAREAAEAGEPFLVLGEAEAVTLRAFAARLLPSDPELPGAEEAGAVYFVDRALAGPFDAMLPPIRAGLEELRRRAREGGARSFAELDGEAQDALLTEMQGADPFVPMRMLVVMGVFADPAHGGNRDGAGWRILGVEHAPAHQPPFGWYDGEGAP